MLAISRSAALCGLDAILITLEVDVSPGLPGFTLVGLPDSAVKEARERVFSALRHSGFEIPSRRMTINLAPANWRKEGSAFDLPMALALLVASGQVELPALDQCLIAGELALDGSIRATRGSIALALAAKEAKLQRIILPAEEALEASWVGDDVQVFPLKNILEAIQLLKMPLPWVNHQGGLKPTSTLPSQSLSHPSQIQIQKPTRNESEISDFADIKGQSQVRRALEVAAAGGHNLLMVGSPGCGKSLMARSFAGLLPALQPEESLEVMRIYSCAGLLNPQAGRVRQRPFRQPHHSLSPQALVGGGHHPRPGEISLAHHGVLFLDELPEFKRSALEALRQPLEEGEIQISRSAMTYRFPARFMLLAAMNPCPCGYLMDIRKACTCTPDEISRYRSRISGPLLDRIDLHIEVMPVAVNDLQQNKSAEPTSEILRRVERARARQRERFQGYPELNTNSQLRLSERKLFCRINPLAQRLLENAMKKLGLSARAYDRILKVALTLSDLSESQEIQECHIAEAIHYRCLDRPIS